MKFKLPLWVVFTSTGIGGLSAQTNKPEVFASGGKTATAGSYQVSYTIGEPLTQQFNAGNIVLTQGFHQPIKGFVGIEENFNLSVQVFPNPTADEVQIVLPEGTGSYTLAIYNQQGQLVRKFSSSETHQKISLKDEAAASYFLQISGNAFNNQYTIIKTH